MNKFLFLSILFSMYSVLSLAQSVVTVGKPYAVIDADQKFYFAKGNEILTVKIDRRSVILQKMNSASLTFQKMKLYDDFPKDYVLEKITQFQDKFYLFYSYWNGDNEQLFAREIDFAGGSFKSLGKKVFTIDKKVAGELTRTGFFSVGKTDKFDFFFSYDSSTMVVQYRMQPEKRNDDKSFDVIGMHVFNKDLKELWSNKVKMPYTEKKMDNLDYCVDTKGNVFIATRIFEDNTTDIKKRDKEEPNYHLEVLKISAPKGDVTKTKINIAGKFIKTIWLKEGVKGEMVCAGFYNIGKNALNADGVFMFKLLPNSEVSNLVTHEIPMEILNQYASGKAKRQNKRKEDDDKAELEDLRLREILTQADGSVLLIGEQYFVVTRTTTSSNPTTGAMSTRSYNIYYYQDILVTRIDQSGKLVWMKKLPKRQKGGNGMGGMSYTYFKGKQDHYFIYLDNVKNLDIPTNEVPAEHVDGLGGFLTAYSINDRTGEVAKKSLLDTRDVKGIEVSQFMTSRIMPVAPTTFVFEVYKRKKEDVLIKVEIEK